MKGIIGKKIGMSQIFDDAGNVVPVTIIEAGPCVVMQKKTAENDGYKSVKLGYSDVKPQRMSKPDKGQFDKAQLPYKKHIKEFDFDNFEEMNIGDIIKADLFAAGDKIDVTGTSKGKGYAGVVKRWNAHEQAATHGVGPVHRSVGSTGANTDPSRTVPGKKMAGHLGSEQVTIMNLDIVKIDSENNLIAVKGAIPGPKNGVVYIRASLKK